ncbi:MAG: hypothetical protein HQM10_13015 [Candidatus Riflebacteria bacterium]|nr:hypothetical protein [Candidatus Riflebacteria bacterium]
MNTNKILRALSSKRFFIPFAIVLVLALFSQPIFGEEQITVKAAKKAFSDATINQIQSFAKTMGVGTMIYKVVVKRSPLGIAFITGVAVGSAIYVFAEAIRAEPRTEKKAENEYLAPETSLAAEEGGRSPFNESNLTIVR